MVTDFIGGVINFLVSGPKVTAQQAHDMARAEGNEETIHARAVAEAVQANEEAHDWRQHAEKTGQQEKSIRLAATLGLPATAEATLNRDEHERRRESEREL